VTSKEKGNKKLRKFQEISGEGKMNKMMFFGIAIHE
jgi:hypothetical protein